MQIGLYIKQLREEKGLTQEQLGEKVGVKKAAVQKWESGTVVNLKRKTIMQLAEIFNVPAHTFVSEDDTLPSNIIPLPQRKNIPLLGTIACGEPILATENIDGFVSADENITADFALKCKGDSMINARIFDGDIVYIRQQADVENGEIAAVLIGEDATLKRVHKYENKIVLSPANPMYDDLIYSGERLNEIKILGKAVAFTSIVR